MNIEELKILVEELRALSKENEWAEFKESYYEPQLIGEYLSALSNSACLENRKFAYLVFGIVNNTHNIVGTSFKPLKKKIGNQELENWLATQLEPKIDFKILEFEINEKSLALFQIDATINTPVKFKGEAYIRVGSYKKKLKDHPEKERKIWEKVKNIVFEKEYAEKNITSDQVLKLLSYPTVFTLLDIPLPPNKEAILEKLEEEKLIVKKLDNYHITNLGAILFANDLNDFEALGRKAPRVVIYKGINKLSTIKEQTGVKGYALGFEGMVDYINDQLPSNEEIGRVFRKEVRVYPELAIRELVANAIIHQDFTITGTSPMIEIFENRIEITNPGKPLIDTQRFIDHSPVSRNEMIAGLMRRMNFCEERGSGIDKVIFKVEVFQLPAPEFISGNNYTRVILFSPKTLKQMDRIDKIRATYQHCSLKYVSGEIMTNKSLRQRFSIDEKNYSTVSRIIKDAIVEGVIQEYDPTNKSRKYAKYIPFWAR